MQVSTKTTIDANARTVKTTTVTYSRNDPLIVKDLPPVRTGFLRREIHEEELFAGTGAITLTDTETTLLPPV